MYPLFLIWKQRQKLLKTFRDSNNLVFLLTIQHVYLTGCQHPLGYLAKQLK